MLCSSLALLALASTALAAPHRHHPAGTGGPGVHTHGPFGRGNATDLAGPTGTGMVLSTGAPSSVPAVSTVTVVPLPVSSAAAVGAAANGTGDCGTAPPTTTITSTDIVYVTVTEGDVAAAPTLASPTAPYPMANATTDLSGPTGTGVAFSSFAAPAAPSSAVVAPVASSVSSPAAYQQSSAAAASSAAASSYAPASSAAPSSYAPASSAAPSRHAPSSYAPASSAAPASTSAAAASSSTASSSGSSGSGKRGLSYNTASLTDAFASSSDITWAYNWGNSPSGTLPSNLEFVPMLWGLNSVSGWSSAASSAISSGSKHLLSFNEPDLGAQSNMSPQDAATAHQTNLNPFSGKASIGSPAVTNSGATGQGLSWMQDFFNACNGKCKVDFMPFHWYDSASNSAYFKSYVTQAIATAQKNGISKVWITEFGASGSSDEQASFLKDVMPWLDSQAAVERYAYFMCSDGVLISGTSMSALGKTYVS